MRTKIKDLVSVQDHATIVGKTFTVKGWIKTVRNQKNFVFVELNDGSTFLNLQIIVEPTVPNFDKLLAKLTTGASLSVTGPIVESPGQNQLIEMHPKEVSILGSADAENYPLQKKRHSFEFLRTIAHLRPRTNTFGAVTRVQNALAFATHKFFQERGFLYVHTPIITGADCEGAGQMFQVTTLDMQASPRN